ncbi:MAG: hypothetical protein GQF41_1903 [Candidatus Rifleibacterium amylolyticum]|nr:MAG: hypothetical protein GQF41_1903 [Candidatus Rifleibacterium amylolyticum]
MFQNMRVCCLIGFRAAENFRTSLSTFKQVVIVWLCTDSLSV